MYRTAEFEQDLKRRGFEGFKFSKGIMAYRWTQKNNEVVRMILMGYRRYTSPGESSIFNFERPLIAIQFPKVELILETIMKRFSTDYQSKKEWTIQAKISSIETINYEALKIDISCSEAFDCVFDEVEDIVYKAGIPFFEKYQTLESAFQYAEQMSIDEMSRFIAQPLPLRRMILKKLCNDPNYEAYADGLIEYYKTDKDDFPHIVEALHAHLMENY